MGSQSVMFKAEVDIDGREITRSYLERTDIELILKVWCKKGKTYTQDFLWLFLFRKCKR